MLDTIQRKVWGLERKEIICLKLYRLGSMYVFIVLKIEFRFVLNNVISYPTNCSQKYLLIIGFKKKPWIKKNVCEIKIRVVFTFTPLKECELSMLSIGV